MYRLAERPLAYAASTASMAGYQDLDDSDVILAAVLMKNVLLIYTTRGIWQLQIVGGEAVFSVSKRWMSGQGGKRTLAYPNSLVSTGENHYYFGFDGIYRYGMFDQEPEQVQWIHKASKRIFSDIEKDRCGMVVGGYQSDKNLNWWSWGASGEQCPSQTFIINVANAFATYVDYAFTAFLQHEPDSNKTLRTWILEMCICTAETLDSNGAGLIKEGAFCTQEPTYTCDSNPASFFSNTAKVDGDITSEDWTVEPDADSLYSILGGSTVSELCGNEFREDDCNADRVFLMASASDYCLKEASSVYYREYCVDFTRGGCGQYERSGYQSRLLSGPLDLKLPDDDKIINRFAIEQHSQSETVPAQVTLKIGAASHAVDPMADGGRCVIRWDELDDRQLACLSDVDTDTHDEEGTRPNDELEWGPTSTTS